MRALKSYVKRALVEHPKSTAAGMAALVGIGFAAWADPKVLASPVTMGLIVGALGGIFYGPKGQ